MIAQVGVSSANKMSVTDAALSLPTVRTTITSWFRPIVLGKITKSIVDFEIREAIKELRCMGVIQPFAPAQLRLKPEGQRSWQWKMLHTTPDVHLENDERFKIKGIPYRVMSHQDYSDYGYRAYELVEDYTKAPHG
jgi:hypothetical protein